MKRYFNIFLALIKNNFIQVMEFRVSFFIALIIDIAHVFLQIWVVNITFQYTNSILDWNKYEVMILIGFFRIVKGIFDVYARRNLFTFPQLVNTGEFDYFLVKPINSLFLMSFRSHSVNDISSLISGLLILFYSFNVANYTFPLEKIALMLVLIILSFICFYSFFAMFSTLSIFTSRLTSINEFQDVVSQTVRYPMDIITRSNPTMELLLFPLILFFTFPLKILLSKIPMENLALQVFLTGMLFFAMIKFWNFATKRYSSASS